MESGIDGVTWWAARGQMGEGENEIVSDEAVNTGARARVWGCALQVLVSLYVRTLRLSDLRDDGGRST